ncbi:MAG TPA: hypothetical protein VGJ05_02775 [Fimbriiglobus sp.]|jgi:hypothetical protein
MFGLGMQELLILIVLGLLFGTVAVFAVLALRRSAGSYNRKLEDENRRLREENERLKSGE